MKSFVREINDWLNADDGELDDGGLGSSRQLCCRGQRQSEVIAHSHASCGRDNLHPLFWLVTPWMLPAILGWRGLTHFVSRARLILDKF
jgi:hypothetical protein